MGRSSGNSDFEGVSFPSRAIADEIGVKVPSVTNEISSIEKLEAESADSTSIKNFHVLFEVDSVSCGKA